MIGTARLECSEPAAEAGELIWRQVGDSFGDFFNFHVAQYSTGAWAWLNDGIAKAYDPKKSRERQSRVRESYGTDCSRRDSPDIVGACIAKKSNQASIFSLSCGLGALCSHHTRVTANSEGNGTSRGKRSQA